MEFFKKIAVLMGGTSNEREVSLVSGKNVVEALQSLNKYEVIPVVLNEDNLSSLPSDIDACYITLHGGWGESGGVQSALDKLEIPYTGPGAQASAITMSKIETKKVLDKAGIPNAPWAIVKDKNAKCPISFPCVVKPPMDGSSVGISLVKSEDDWQKALSLALDTDAGYRKQMHISGEPEALVEEFIPGREMTVGVIGHTALPVVDICAPDGWYGYEEKYESDETRYPFPDDDFLPEMQRLAVAAFDATECRGITRVDFRITDDGRMYVLELNTSPGMTGHSLIPKAAGKLGLSFPEICDKILAEARHD
jgi:D-alanine-D-alanine ligase